MRSWLLLAARWLLGAVWIAAGVAKLPDPAESVRAVRAYQLLPEAVVPAVGYGLPILEIAIGVLLIVGLGTRVAALISAVLLLAFVVGIGSAWARGLQIECGCFGGGGLAGPEAAAAYPGEIARDIALLAVAAVLTAWPTGRFSVDGLLAGRAFADRDHGRMSR